MLGPGRLIARGLTPELRTRLTTGAQSIPRRLRRRLGVAVAQERFELRSTAGYRIAGAIWRPAAAGPHPAVVLCPGTNDPGSVFEGWSQPLNAKEIAAQGVVACWFDPAGRGDSTGAEDYGGPEHQDDLRVTLRYIMRQPWVDPERVGVVSISLGLVMAAGALARWSEELPVAFLLDWEGPSDREIITAGGRIMAPALGHGLDDAFYWSTREPTRALPRLRCGYQRVQAERDHAQPGELRHAQRAIDAAASGELPWFRLNDHAPGEQPESPRWIPGGRLAANRFLMESIKRLA